MKQLYTLFLLLTYASWTAAQDPALFASIPECAKICTGRLIRASSCAGSDASCICTNTQLQGMIEGCVRQTCTVKQSLTAKNLSSTLCGAPVSNIGSQVKVLNITLFSITAAIALIRLLFKSFSDTNAGWDDYAIIAALLTGIPSVVLVDILLIPNGLDRDIWTLPFDSIATFRRSAYILPILYFLQIGLVKISIIFFLLRIFPRSTTRKLLYGTLIFTALWTVAFILGGALQCQLPSFYWTSWDMKDQKSCLNFSALNWANSLLSIALDAWMLAIPLYEVIHLQLSWRRKLSVSLMFFVGTFVTVVSALRLQSIVHLDRANNPTRDLTAIVYWSSIEQDVGIICSCMPALRKILVRAYPLAFASKNRSSRKHCDYGSYSHDHTGNEGGKETVEGDANRSQKSNTAPNTFHTQTFDVQFEQNLDNDESALVEMGNIARTLSRAHSSNVSEASL
ncbi:hypothetical protein COCSADRAFT_80286 [Bipolaris sorokiniana ND90Pr]|uniref:CFEM domain-containing protein n=1 Tax=Cochliobolus sativus (strain ND90Pr / ATCC 201652) TaxID=665912 RepID=M2SMR1_COCSN|nr:uncharacterized protein COCSADRAFT_80286 [Bipolaris sorokiniana ND90Pr]EMD68453.1 hypothetical protein COCSADRAFT_80286 [Bipolaris sorokiniana ND90Pr]